MLIDDAVLADVPELTAFRRDLHAHPELAFDEHRTAAAIARELERIGIPFVAGLGGTGIVGVLRRGTSTRAVGLRADIDALPILERSAFGHASANAGVMHACGHDGHTAMLLGAARQLARGGDFNGTVYLIFQPGEESGRGALAMIADGLFERFPMEAVFGAHNWPNLPVGSFAVAPGPVMGSCNEFTIEIEGTGGHAALPHQAVDPVQPACQIAVALQSIVSRNLAPSETAVLSVTKIRAGDLIHAIPGNAVLQGTIRTFSDTVTDLMEQRLRDIAARTSGAYGATCTVDFVRNCAPTVNAPREAGFVRDTLRALAGDDAVQMFVPSMTAEDFSFMLQAKAGCYFLIGNGEGDHRAAGTGDGPCVLHNASYDFNDDLIPIGAMAWARIAERWLGSADADQLENGSATRGQ